jgi:sensor histidine kinase YesM
MASPQKYSTILLRSVGISFAWGIALGSIFFFTSGGGSLRDWAIGCADSITYSLCIAVPSTAVFVKTTPRLRRLRPSLQVLAYMAILLPIAVAGCLLADVLFVAVGRREGGELLAQLAADLRVVLMISLVTGTGIIGYERLRDRLEDANARLREEELARERALRLAADAQLSSLESRIRPHFLFNALNAVLALIPEDPKRAEEVLERFTGLLRASLRADGDGLVPFAQETALVRDYLEIERVRFGDRLRFTIDVPEGLESVAVPAFSVQTLVENSVKHAAGARRGGAEVKVTARADGERAAFAVEDDGPGFDGASLPAGHGLATLRSRIEALFGAAGTLDVERAPSGGARVVMRVPVRAREAA